MVKAKRAQIVSLTSAKKKTKQDREPLFEKIQEAFSTYSHVYLIRVKNIRNNFLKQVREDLQEDSKLFFGRITLMTKALKLANGDSVDEALGEFCQRAAGSNIGLVFSNMGMVEFKAYCDQIEQQDYARAGFIATETITVPKGIVMRADKEPISHTFEGQLRANGMPVLLKNGMLVLDEDHVICRGEEVLTAQQARLLKIFERQMASSHILPVLCYSDGRAVEF